MADTPDKKDKAMAIKKNLEALKDKISYIKEIHVGINFNETESASDIVLESVFETEGWEALRGRIPCYPSPCAGGAGKGACGGDRAPGHQPG